MTVLMQALHLLSYPALTAVDTGSHLSDMLLGLLFSTIALIGLVIAAGFYVLMAVFYMKLFAKANVPAWKAWVPFVNTWKFLELGGYSGAWCLFLIGGLIPYIGWLISLVTTVFACLSAYQISLKNGKDGAWVVLYIFLPIVWLGIFGLGKSTWNENLGKPALGPERPPFYPVYHYI